MARAPARTRRGPEPARAAAEARIRALGIDPDTWAPLTPGQVETVRTILGAPAQTLPAARTAAET